MSPDIKVAVRGLLEHLHDFFDAHSAAESGPSQRPVHEVILDGTLFMVNNQMDLHARNEQLTGLCPKGAEPYLHRALPLRPTAVAYMVDAARCLAIDAEALEESLSKNADDSQDKAAAEDTSEPDALALDISCAFGCMKEARDLLGYLIRECGPDLAHIYGGEIKRAGDFPDAGLTSHRNALEILARVLSLTTNAIEEGAEKQEAIERLGVVLDVRDRVPPITSASQNEPPACETPDSADHPPEAPAPDASQVRATSGEPVDDLRVTNAQV